MGEGVKNIDFDCEHENKQEFLTLMVRHGRKKNWWKGKVKDDCMVWLEKKDKKEK